jgi:ABC-type uncharacterized transport system substrate-binding protein
MHAFLFALVATLCAAVPTLASAAGRVLFVNSYHQGYPWSDGEETGAAQALAGSGVKLDFFRMDTKRHPEAKAQEEQAQKLKALIDAEKPDVVIAADDNATRVMVKHYKNSPQRWVFCGVNWDASTYGLPFSNTTGINEVALTERLMASLKTYAKGDRIGFLTVDTETERIEGSWYKKQLGMRLTQERYVKTLADWKKEFVKMQGEVDVLLLGNYAGINDWNEAEAAAWALEHSRIVSGGMYDFMMPYSMIGMTKLPEEQGVWAGKAALQIIKGASPSSIPVSANKQAGLFLNVKLASKAGIVFKPELVKTAQVMR